MFAYYHGYKTAMDIKTAMDVKTAMDIKLPSWVPLDGYRFSSQACCLTVDV